MSSEKRSPPFFWHCFTISSAFQHNGRTMLQSVISSESIIFNIYFHVMCNTDSFIGLKMALFNRIGNMLRQSVSRHTNMELCASRTSLYQAIRSMSSSKLFVGGKKILFLAVWSGRILVHFIALSWPNHCRSLIWHWWNISARGILPVWSSGRRYLIYDLTSDKIKLCILIHLRGSWSL